MTRLAQLYLALIVLAGPLVFWAAWGGREPVQPLELAVFTVIIAVASALKVPLARVNGTLSVGFIFKLVALVQLGPFQTLAVSGLGVLAQAFWKAERRPLAHQIAFNVSTVWAALAMADRAWKSAALMGLGTTMALVAAAGAYFLVNTWSVTGILALTEKQNAVKIWRECYFWSFPYYLVGGGIAGMFVLCLQYGGWGSALFVAPIIYLVHRSYRLYMGRLEDEKVHAEELAALHLRTIEALAMAIEAKDQTTHDHLQRVRVYAIELGKELEISEEEMLALQAASMLHDIGKLAVPEHIIGKPGKLTKEEFEKVKIHPVVGAEILERVRFPYPVVPIVRSHHEKWDGSGYPDGLSSEEIPIGARILSAVDCLDALASDRQYRRALPLDEAMQVVASESGKAFDPQVVEILERRYVELEEMAKATPTEPMEQLSTAVPVERGEAPAAGFEEVSQSAPGSGEPIWSSIASARREAQMFFNLTRDLGSSLSLEQTVETLPERLGSLIEFDCLAVFTKRDDKLVPAQVVGVDREVFAALEIPVGEGLSGWVAENDRAILNGNPAVEAGYMAVPTGLSTMRSALAVPLSGISGVIGILALYSRQAAAFSHEDLRIVTGISSRVGLAIENALKYREASQSATEDYLTGLPNARAMFQRLDDELSRARRDRKPLALLVCDLNGFKAINDTRGHLEGNRILKEVAAVLREHSREYDLAARMGGDEFVVVFPGLEKEHVERRIETLREEVNKIADEVSLSIGASYFPADGDDAEQLLVEADGRMYLDKSISKGKPPPPSVSSELEVAAR